MGRDEQQRGPVPFYNVSSARTPAALEKTGRLHFHDSPKVHAPSYDSCPSHSGPLQSVTFHDSLETCLVAKHNPSGCYTVLKHFTWSQTAHSISLNPIDGVSSTTVSGVDNGLGGSPKLIPPYSNGSGQRICP